MSDFPDNSKDVKIAYPVFGEQLNSPVSIKENVQTKIEDEVSKRVANAAKWILTVIFSVVFGGIIATMWDLNAKINNVVGQETVRNEIADLQKMKIEYLKNELDSQKKRVEALKKDTDSQQNRIETLKSQNRSLKKQHSVLKATNEKTTVKGMKNEY